MALDSSHLQFREHSHLRRPPKRAYHRSNALYQVSPARGLAARPSRRLRGALGWPDGPLLSGRLRALDRAQLPIKRCEKLSPFFLSLGTAPRRAGAAAQIHMCDTALPCQQAPTCAPTCAPCRPPPTPSQLLEGQGVRSRALGRARRCRRRGVVRAARRRHRPDCAGWHRLRPGARHGGRAGRRPGTLQGA